MQCNDEGQANSAKKSIYNKDLEDIFQLNSELDFIEKLDR